MNAVKGVYQNGEVDLLEKPQFETPVEVLVIFSEKQKKVKKNRRAFQRFSG